MTKNKPLNGRSGVGEPRATGKPTTASACNVEIRTSRTYGGQSTDNFIALALVESIVEQPRGEATTAGGILQQLCRYDSPIR
jgi:hypothetical protein